MCHDLDNTLVQLINNAPQNELPELRNADVSIETTLRAAKQTRRLLRYGITF
jgi:hypothetical protein